METYDVKRNCPKCGAKANTKYGKQDIIIRTCVLCGYVWKEQSLDFMKKENKDENKDLLLEDK